MTRSTRNIVLALIGSAGLLTCCFPACNATQEEEEKDQEGRVVRHVHRPIYRPWYWPVGWGWGWGGGGSYRSQPAYGPSYRPGSGTGGSRPSGTTTSRGGFGGTGHATSGG
jgi:hypothetical protein